MSAREALIGEQTLAFLVQHRLRPDPQNYSLAYIALTDPQSAIGAAVHAIASGGYRIRQDDADAIVAGTTSLESTALSRGESEDQRALRHQTIKLNDLACAAAHATGEFVRDLSTESGHLNGSGVLEIIGRMLENSRKTENALNQAVAEVAALRAKLEEARDDATRDQLSGLYNRRAIDERLKDLAVRRRTFAVGICDIDNFKSVNDRFGHGVGDRVIKLVAGTLAENCEPNFVGRWGGEEFVVIFEGDSIRRGVEFLDRARTDLAGRNFKLRDTDEAMGALSFSGGVALARPDDGAIPSAIERADAALYRAKRLGKNRIECDFESGAGDVPLGRVA